MSDGTISGTVTYSDVDAAISFESQLAVISSNLPDVSGNWEFSVTIWVYFSSSVLVTSLRQSIIFIGSGAGTATGIGLVSFPTTRQIDVFIWGAVSFIVPDYALPEDTWTHLGVTYSSAGNRQFYVDGVLKGEFQHNTFLNLPNNPELRIGNSPSTSHQSNRVSFSRFRLYDKVLTSSAIQAEYDIPRAPGV